MAEVRSKSDPGGLPGDVTFLPMEAVGDRGDFDRDNVKARNEIGTGYSYFEEGDVVRAKVTPCFENGKGAVLSGLVGGCGFGSTELLVLRPLPGVDPRFLYYILVSHEFTSQGAGCLYGAHGVKRVPEKFFRDFVAWSPSELTQRAIGDFLDREISRIDALIEKKQRLMELRSERLFSFVERATTGQSIERQAVRTTDVPGLPRVAADWPVVPLKALWRVIDCKHRTPIYVSDGYPVVSTGEVTPGVLDLGRANRFVDHLDFLDMTEGGRQPRRGNLVYSRNASIGTASLVGSDDEFCMGQDVVLVATPESAGPFLMFFLNGPGARQLTAYSVGATFKRINVARIRKLAIPAPPAEVQERLGREISVEQATHDRTVRLLSQQIGLLHERRQALVTAAVTGQLDITGAA